MSLMEEERWKKLQTTTWFEKEQREVMAYVNELRVSTTRTIAEELALLKELNSLRKFKASVEEALNSGEGVSRP